MKRTKLKSFLSFRTANEAFHSLFPSIEETEEAVAAFNCAYSKDILHQGKLYITPHHFCFHSNIFGFEDRVVIDCRDVSAITREKAALIFPTAILVRCGNVKYLFASFLRREQAYRLMFRVWQSVLLGNALSTEELSQSKKYHYRRLEQDITQDDANSSPELSRSRSADNADNFTVQFHPEMRHRRTRSDGSSMTSSRSSDENFESDTVQLHPQVYVSTSAVERESLTPDPHRGPQLQANVSSPNRLRVSFDIKEVSDGESANDISPAEEEASRTDLSSDPEQSVAGGSSSRKELKRKNKKKGKLAKLLHLHHTPRVEEDHNSAAPLSSIETALCSALSLGLSAAPCAFSGRGTRVGSTEQSGGLSQQADVQEVEIQGNSEEGRDPSAMEVNFQTELKRIPLQINSKLSRFSNCMLERIRSISGATLLMIFAFVCVVMVCFSIALLACQLAALDPFLGTIYPLSFLCTSEGLQQSWSSSNVVSEDVTVDKLAASLKDFQQENFNLYQTGGPASNSERLWGTSAPVTESMSERNS